MTDDKNKEKNNVIFGTIKGCLVGVCISGIAAIISDIMNYKKATRFDVILCTITSGFSGYLATKRKNEEPAEFAKAVENARAKSKETPELPPR